jgi:hypothetical protein
MLRGLFRLWDRRSRSFALIGLQCVSELLLIAVLENPQASDRIKKAEGDPRIGVSAGEMRRRGAGADHGDAGDREAGDASVPGTAEVWLVRELGHRL